VFQLNTLLREAKKLRTIKSANITKINEFCKLKDFRIFRVSEFRIFKMPFLSPCPAGGDLVLNSCSPMAHEIWKSLFFSFSPTAKEIF
jgi:hypothetical protein